MDRCVHVSFLLEGRGNDWTGVCMLASSLKGEGMSGQVCAC